MHVAEGDPHDIGKNIAAVLLKSNGYGQSTWAGMFQSDCCRQRREEEAQFRDRHCSDDHHHVRVPEDSREIGGEWNPHSVHLRRRCGEPCVRGVLSHGRVRRHGHTGTRPRDKTIEGWDWKRLREKWDESRGSERGDQNGNQEIHKDGVRSADEMVFGEAKYPLSYGLGQKVGAGLVVPEINFAPRPGAEKTPESLTREYVDYITKDILDRAVTLGFPSVQLENEWIFQMVNDLKKYAKPVVAGQKEIMQKYHDEYGIALRYPPHLCRPQAGRDGPAGGHGQDAQLPREDHRVLRGRCRERRRCAVHRDHGWQGGRRLRHPAARTSRGWLFGIGYLGSIDMAWIWPQIVDIAKKNKVVAGGDTNCAGANTSMFMAGGYLDRDIPRTFAAVTRCIASARTLVAIECGATGPDKDCGYEGPDTEGHIRTPVCPGGQGCPGRAR